MPVRMRMMRPEEQCDAKQHERSGDRVLHGPSLAQNRHGNQRSDEGSGGKEPRLTRRTEQPKGTHVEHQTHPVTDESQQQCRQRHRGRRPRLAGENRQAEHPETGAEGLDARDHQRIAKRETLTQIVIDRPAETGAQHGKDADKVATDRAWLIGEYPCSSNDRKDAGQFESDQMFAKDKHGNQHGEERFQIQEQ